MFRGDNLCAWETGLRRPLRSGEIVIDPDIGRVLIGAGHRGAARRADRAAKARGLVSRIFVSFTYGAAGPVGAHPVSREVPRRRPRVDAAARRRRRPAASRCRRRSAGLDTATEPVVIEIHDSLVHRIDLSALPGTAIDGGVSLRLAQSLTIRAAGGHRPIVLLAQPLAFRPVNGRGGDDRSTPEVRLEGLYLAPRRGHVSRRRAR